MFQSGKPASFRPRMYISAFDGSPARTPPFRRERSTRIRASSFPFPTACRQSSVRPEDYGRWLALDPDGCQTTCTLPLRALPTPSLSTFPLNTFPPPLHLPLAPFFILIFIPLLPFPLFSPPSLRCHMAYFDPRELADVVYPIRTT